MQEALTIKHKDVSDSPAFYQSQSDALAKVKTWFYQGEFELVIESIDNLNWADFDDAHYCDLQIIKSNALYELQHVKAAMELIEALEDFRKIHDKAALTYAKARQFYFEAAYSEAEQAFASINFLSQDPVLKFRGLLGLANVYQSQNRFDDIPKIIAKLEQLKSEVGDEDRISFYILLGNYYRASGSDKMMARLYFNKALGMATVRSWTYFMMRCLYGLATVEQADSNKVEMRCILTVLKSMLKDSQFVFLRFLVNEKFKEDSFCFEVPLEMDAQNMRVRISDRWYNFHAKPLLFTFIEFLANKKRFVSKAELAERLWPSQRYLARTHDPRIFDIAKRIRNTIELCDTNPVVLLSGRQGYKLACATNGKGES